MQSAYEIKKEICDIGARIYQKGYVAANDGNISVKVGPNEFYCTPTGVSKGYMTPDMIIRVDGQGNKLEGKLNPSSEFKMHLRVYQERPDVNAVVHAHPPTATAFAVCNIPLEENLLPEAILTVGSVPVCVYGCPSTEEIPDSLMPHLQNHDAFLLQNHGALAVGNTLTKAFFVMDEVEYYAKVSLLARQVGTPQELPCEELEKLMDLRKKFGMPGKHPGCKTCKNRGTANCRCKDNAPAGAKEDLVAQITRQVLAQLGK